MDICNVEFTDAETFLLFSVVTQLIKEMEDQGRNISYPRKYKTLLETKEKLRKCLELQKINDSK